MVSQPSSQPAHWDAYLQNENEILRSGDGAALLAVNAKIPQRWKQSADREAGHFSDYFATVEAASKQGAMLCDGLLSTVYAGTYFSLHQTLRLEQIRGAIEALSSSELISPWMRSVALTALSTAASQAVFSAGKHFAQPHRIREGKDMTFHAKRALSDRSVDVDAVFSSAMKSVAEAAQPAESGHIALTKRVEDVSTGELAGWCVDTIYADPPYTAQQYSRFYHLLETLHAGVPPVLQDFRGSVTRGLYPEDRFKSAFCSKREAPAAFEHLIRMSKDAGARLVISYSGNEGELTGNARTIAMDDLTRLLVKSYGANRVSVEPVRIRYRQFNHALAEVAGRNDPEYVLIGETSAS